MADETWSLGDGQRLDFQEVDGGITFVRFRIEDLHTIAALAAVAKSLTQAGEVGLADDVKFLVERGRRNAWNGAVRFVGEYVTGTMGLYLPELEALIRVAAVTGIGPKREDALAMQRRLRDELYALGFTDEVLGAPVFASLHLLVLDAIKMERDAAGQDGEA